MNHINLTDLQIDLINAITDLSEEEIQTLEKEQNYILFNLKNLKQKKDNIIKFKK